MQSLVSGRRKRGCQWQTDRPGPPRRRRWRSPSAGWAGSHRPARRLTEPGSIGTSPSRATGWEACGSARPKARDAGALGRARDPVRPPPRAAPARFETSSGTTPSCNSRTGGSPATATGCRNPTQRSTPGSRRNEGSRWGTRSGVAAHVHPHADGHRLLERARSDVRSVRARLPVPTERAGERGEGHGVPRRPVKRSAGQREGRAPVPVRAGRARPMRPACGRIATPLAMVHLEQQPTGGTPA